MGRLAKQRLFSPQSPACLCVHALSISIALSQCLALCRDGKHRCFRVSAQANAELCSNTHTHTHRRRAHKEPASGRHPRSLEESDNESDISVHVFVSRCVRLAHFAG